MSPFQKRKSSALLREGVALALSRIHVFDRDATRLRSRAVAVEEDPHLVGPRMDRDPETVDPSHDGAETALGIAYFASHALTGLERVQRLCKQRGVLPVLTHESAKNIHSFILHAALQYIKPSHNCRSTAARGTEVVSYAALDPGELGIECASQSRSGATIIAYTRASFISQYKIARPTNNPEKSR